jgi:transcriptional regulator with XRE-family HTH domain
MTNTPSVLGWKLRRIAAGLRQQDVALQVGISTTRYSAIERGELKPSDLDLKLIERTLPLLPGQLLASPEPKHRSHGE